MKKNDRRYREPWYLPLIPLINGVEIWLLVFGALIAFAFIVTHADKLRWFFVPCLIAFFALLAIPGAWGRIRKERVEEHALIGDELFYAAYPFERWLHRRREARKARREARKVRRSERQKTRSMQKLGR